MQRNERDVITHPTPHGDLKIDIENDHAYSPLRTNRIIWLTPIETNMLVLLVSAPTKRFSRHELTVVLFDEPPSGKDRRTIQIFQRLRKKLGRELMHIVRGEGITLTPPSQPTPTPFST